MNRIAPSLPSHRHARKCGRSAFSLVEVVFALGITAFSLLTILGLFSVGLKSLRMSMTETTRAQIIQKLTSEMLLTKFNSLQDQYDNKVFYYNEFGLRTSFPDQTGTPVALYKVKTSLTQVKYPGSTRTSSNMDLSLKAFRVDFEKLYGEQNTDRSIILIPYSDGQ